MNQLHRLQNQHAEGSRLEVNSPHKLHSAVPWSYFWKQQAASLWDTDFNGKISMKTTFFPHTTFYGFVYNFFQFRA